MTRYPGRVAGDDPLRFDRARGHRQHKCPSCKLGNDLHNQSCLDDIVAELNPGGLLSTAQMHRTRRILIHEVMPALG